MSSEHQQPSGFAQFRRYLAKQGKRFTNERQVVTKTVLLLRSSFTAEAAVTAVALMPDTKISRATVHRTLNDLMERGLIACSSHDDEQSFQVQHEL